MSSRKRRILDELLSKLKSELAELQQALDSSKDLATNQEFKAESKYDTRALEASYLASAEAKRVEDLKLEIQMLEEVDLQDSKNSGVISIGSLVELGHQGQKRSYFLIPTAGGTLLNIDQEAILVVSVFSPLGSQMLGLKSGEDFEVETPKQLRHYSILSHE